MEEIETEINQFTQESTEEEKSDMVLSVFGLCNGGPDCLCDTCSAKKRTGISVSDTVQATLGVCSGYDNGCECLTCKSKEKTGIVGIAQESFNVFTKVTEAKNKLEEVFTALKSIGSMKDLKGVTIFYIIMLCVTSTILFVVGM